METQQPDERFAVLDAAQRVWAVAAIHGEAGKLVALHAELGTRFQPGDRLVYLGNYLGVGGQVAETLDELVLFRRELMCFPGIEPWDIVYLRGAQEEMWRKLLEIQFAPNPVDVYRWMVKQGLSATLIAYGRDPAAVEPVLRERAQAITRWTNALRLDMRNHPGHEDLLASLRRAAYTRGGDLLFVHAGVDRNRPLDAQRDAFWWSLPDFAEEDGRILGFARVISGFDRQHRPSYAGRYFACIDAGCGYGGALDAVCFDLAGNPVDRISIS